MARGARRRARPRAQEGRTIADQRSPRPDDVREWALGVLAAQPSVDSGSVPERLHRICGAAVIGLEMMGAVVTVRSPEAAEAVVAASGPAARALAELEFGLGEGPAHDSFDNRRPVMVDDLTAPGTPWLGFARAAVEAGVRAVYAVPLHVGAARFGALTVYSVGRRRLQPEETRRCLALAELATELLLDSSAASHHGAIDPQLVSALDVRSEIYQAQGMLMVSLRVGLPEALARMRAHAFAAGRDLLDVAADIIAGRLDLDDDGSNP